MASLTEKDRIELERIAALAEPYREGEAEMDILDGDERDIQRVLSTLAKNILDGKIEPPRQDREKV